MLCYHRFGIQWFATEPENRHKNLMLSSIYLEICFVVNSVIFYDLLVRQQTTVLFMYWYFLKTDFPQADMQGGREEIKAKQELGLTWSYRAPQSC